MKFLVFSVAIAILATSSVFAQVKVHPYALKMATETADTLLPGLKPMMDMAFEKMEQDASKSNAAPGQKIFIQEFRNAFNRENFIAILAQRFQSYFTEEDFLELQKFEESKVGRKAAKLQSDSEPQKLIAPILKEACDRTTRRLNATNQPVDDGLKKICNS